MRKRGGEEMKKIDLAHVFETAVVCGIAYGFGTNSFSRGLAAAATYGIGRLVVPAIMRKLK